MQLVVLIPGHQAGGSMIKSIMKELATQHYIKQITDEPTHLLWNFSFCFNLVFTSQQNLVTDAGFHPLLHVYCHHQIVHAKFNLKIHYPHTL